MKAILFCIASLFAVAVVVIGLILRSDPVGIRKDWKEHVAKKELLLSSHAPREEVFRLFGPCTDYSSNGTNRSHLRENVSYNENKLIQEKLSRWPGALYASTANVQTWVFLDSSNRVVDVVLMSQ
jgi:hypothetical protein